MYYSIILDCTPDVNHKEQKTMVIWFVEIKKREGAVIQEHFLLALYRWAIP